MALAYPTFDRTEYACLHPNLCVIDYALKLKALDQEIEGHRKAVEEATTSARTQGKNLLKTLSEELSTLREASPPEVIKRYVEAYRGSLTSQYPHIGDQRRSYLIRLHDEFSTFNKDALEKFFKEHFKDEYAESTDLSKAKQAANGRLTAALDKRKRILETAATDIYRDGEAPKEWRHVRQSGDGMAAEYVTSVIIESFVKDWKQRCVLFECPVTIAGYGIHTLPEERKRIWSDAYKRLGLDKLTKRPTFAFLVSPPEMETMVAPKAMRGIKDNNTEEKTEGG
jgi:hypothetical protein